MKRRNFLKTLSELPVIGLPALAKPDIVMKNGSTITFTDSDESAFIGTAHTPGDGSAVGEVQMYEDPFKEIFKEAAERWNGPMDGPVSVENQRRLLRAARQKMTWLD